MFNHIMVVPTDMLRCQNVHCNTPAHTEAIGKMSIAISNVCLQANEDAIP